MVESLVLLSLVYLLMCFVLLSSFVYMFTFVFYCVVICLFKWLHVDAEYEIIKDFSKHCRVKNLTFQTRKQKTL